MNWMEWYNSLAKPSWTPEPATIGMIWQILYPVIVVTFCFIFVQAIRKKVPWMVALPFAINLLANVIFTPIQFRLRKLPLAAVDILLVWGTIIWMMVAVWKHYRWVAVTQVPYFVWVIRRIRRKATVVVFVSRDFRHFSNDIIEVADVTFSWLGGSSQCGASAPSR